MSEKKDARIAELEQALKVAHWNVQDVLKQKATLEAQLAECGKPVAVTKTINLPYCSPKGAGDYCAFCGEDMTIRSGSKMPCKSRLQEIPDDAVVAFSCKDESWMLREINSMREIGMLETGNKVEHCTKWCKDARCGYSLRPAPPAQPASAVVPDGWQLVPKEPTVKMIAAACASPNWNTSWPAMLAAAPQSLAQLVRQRLLYPPEAEAPEAAGGAPEASATSRPLAGGALPLPGFFSQFLTLLSRRWRIFSRDRGQVLLQVGGTGRLGDCRRADHRQPAQHDLRGTSVVLVRDPGQRRILQQRRLPAPAAAEW